VPSPAALLCALVLSTPQGADPRLPLVEDQLAGDLESALRRTRELAERDPEAAQRLWLLYLEGDLLERLGRPEDAHRKFVELLAEDPELDAYARLRMAALQRDLGHPEMAAGLVARVLSQGAPDALVAARATELLVGALDAGADCQLLALMETWPVGDRERRTLRSAKADCALRQGDREAAEDLLVRLLEQETADLVGRHAADALSALSGASVESPEVQIAMGLAFHHNREFDRAVEHLDRGLAALDPERLAIGPDAIEEYRYASARSRFGLGDYAGSAQRFRELATATSRPAQAAQALYQEARCHELSGQWARAAATFREAFLAQPEGDWSAPALFSALRIDFRMGQEAAALELFSVLDSRPAWREMARRAALFLSASDLERGRGDRAAVWLRRNHDKYEIEEFLYWSSRLDELREEPQRAIRGYVEILKRNPYHPLAEAAAGRLDGVSVAPYVEPTARQLSATGARGDLHGAWVLLGDGHPTGRAAREALLTSLRSDRRAQAYLSIARVPARSWPLWQSTLTRPADRLLALGLWGEGRSRLTHHFPANQPSLAFSATALLDQAGLDRDALRIAEVLAHGAPEGLPAALWPAGLKRQLYPYPYREMIESEARRHGVEPALLAALIREESRFDPLAVSAAAARGLTQFVHPTAQRIAAMIALELDGPESLHQPEAAIALGAAYLGDLLERFDGRVEDVIAAYNAGEDQARLWRSYCYSRNPAEYFSKVGFAQTRGYLRKVLSSRVAYEEIYGSPSPAAR
jgi:soluble lytic murein transglycosylase